MFKASEALCKILIYVLFIKRLPCVPYLTEVFPLRIYHLDFQVLQLNRAIFPILGFLKGFTVQSSNSQYFRAWLQASCKPLLHPRTDWSSSTPDLHLIM
ncbi:hypothetical protein L6452_00235 [Arctium lappa]|uniref:Uncharacterized protein n=1 Tax=Arctium lappa TaxID=4217 RepID=A0ACB9FE51_ARCLA|nr:hypothetical protein L6452_00235 [Arctium lappa]